MGDCQAEPYLKFIQAPCQRRRSICEWSVVECVHTVTACCLNPESPGVAGVNIQEEEIGAESQAARRCIFFFPFVFVCLFRFFSPEIAVLWSLASHFSRKTDLSCFLALKQCRLGVWKSVKLTLFPAALTAAASRMRRESESCIANSMSGLKRD